MPDATRVRAPAMSFIVRVWSDHEENEPRLRGEVEHIGTGEKRPFLDEWSLLSLIDPRPARWGAIKSAAS